MHRHSLIHKVFWRTVEAAVLLLVGAFLGAGSATAAQDGSAAPPTDAGFRMIRTTSGCLPAGPAGSPTASKTSVRT